MPKKMMPKQNDSFRGEHGLRTLTADLFVSLDGFASGPGEAPYFGYFGEDLGNWIAENLKQPQLLIMGRVTYEALAQFSPAATDPASQRMNELPKLVFSSTLTAPLVWNNTRLAKVPLAEEIKALKAQPGDPLRSIGSISLVRTMVGLGVVDRLRLMVFPVILGNAGREPIFTSYSRTPLELVAGKVLDSRLTLLEYRPVSAA
jgi:dihydrofolate reductase